MGLGPGGRGFPQPRRADSYMHHHAQNFLDKWGDVIAKHALVKLMNTAKLDRQPLFARHLISLDVALRRPESWASTPAEPLGPERGMMLNSGGFFFPP